ncbi:T9SS type A sorting domain-containing protein [Paracrocinitomix mangrovi]|uniref:T9SS type A sorting domain-containing protein n=1 Tax=Paracrocinitomix mangrovi TaxID=2862509 RepID=UPI001C8D36F0|nr:T9SS type A sorting domain-containing protein [Paracrocinitomix mangrovi]UKN01136.1 T9SS type A sorting domain-containing protein [Paracrocinitomix mangrovi]
MKKILLLFSVLLAAAITNAQVIFYVEAPSSNEGNYDMTYASGTSWGSPDMTDPANSVTGELCMADDGTAGDSLACNAVVNNLTGKVACLYRGSCEFGVKALNAQNAGAIAVIIINNIPGSPVGMNGGTQGTNVNIPVIMISDVAGATLKAEMEACSGTTVFIGSKTGYYANDLGFYPEHVLRAENFGNIQELSQNASEFSVELGAWVINYGSDPQTNVVLSATVDNGSNLYTNSGTAIATLASGDSAFVSLPTFSQSTYANGYYNVVYTITSDQTEDFPDDNTQNADFMMSDSLFSYSRINTSTNHPEAVAYYRSSDAVSSNSGCLAFRDPNASRVAIKGMTFSGTTSQNPNPTSIDGEYVQVFAYEWNDVFTDLNDANYAVSNLNQIASAEYIYTADLQQEQIYVDFESPVLLIDDQRYLFCFVHYGENVYSGYDTEIDYNWNLETYLQPQFPGESDGSWFATGFGTDIVPALTVNMFATAVGIEEETANDNILAYPNPANVEVNIPMGENYGAIALTITDMAGKVISTQNIEMQGPVLKVDVSSLASGTYLFNVLHGDENEVMTISIAK